MPYDNENNFNNDVVDLVGSEFDLDSSEQGQFENDYAETQTEFDVLVPNEFSSSELLSLESSEFDYSYLDDIIANQEIIIANQETIISLDQEIVNNGHRLYYFVGGLYVAFAIIIMVKFFKTFLF